MHRDLKPQNIMIDENYKIKLIDFGQVKKINFGKIEIKKLKGLGLSLAEIKERLKEPNHPIKDGSDLQKAKLLADQIAEKNQK